MAGSIYQFTTAGDFTNSGEAGTAGSFNMKNLYTGSAFNFGLSQSATINGSSLPVCITPVPYNQNAGFVPIETLSVFVASYSNNGVVISTVDLNALVVQLTAAWPVATIYYDDATNTFQMGSLPVSP